MLYVETTYIATVQATLAHGPFFAIEQIRAERRERIELRQIRMKGQMKVKREGE